MLAFERLGLTGAALDDLSPVELEDLFEAWDRAEERRTRRLVWAVASLVSPHVKESERSNLGETMLRGLVGDEQLERWEARRRVAEQEMLRREVERE